MDNNSYFASDLGWTPGQWPFTAVIDGKTYTRHRQERHGGEFVGYVYRGNSGTVIIWND